MFDALTSEASWHWGGCPSQGEVIPRENKQLGERPRRETNQFRARAATSSALMCPITDPCPTRPRTRGQTTRGQPLYAALCTPSPRTTTGSQPPFPLFPLPPGLPWRFPMWPCLSALGTVGYNSCMTLIPMSVRLTVPDENKSGAPRKHSTSSPCRRPAPAEVSRSSEALHRVWSADFPSVLQQSAV